MTYVAMIVLGFVLSGCAAATDYAAVTRYYVFPFGCPTYAPGTIGDELQHVRRIHAVQDRAEWWHRLLHGSDKVTPFGPVKR